MLWVATGAMSVMMTTGDARQKVEEVASWHLGAQGGVKVKGVNRFNAILFHFYLTEHIV